MEIVPYGAISNFKHPKMKIFKYFLIGLSLFILCSESWSQSWIRTFGDINKIEFSNDIIETYDKGFIIIGDIGNSKRKGWMIKTDVNGEVLWEKILSTELKSIQPIAIDETNEQGYVIVGHITSGQTRNPYITKINSCGEKEWCTTLYKDNGAYAWDVIVKDNGEILVLTAYMGDEIYERIHLYCFDSNGNVLWRNRYASKYDHPLLEAPEPNKFYGLDDGYMIVGSGYYPQEDDPNGLKPIRALFIKVDQMGNEEWLLPYGKSSLLLSTGKVFTENNNGYYTGFGTHYTDSLNPIIMNFDYHGNQIDYHILENDTLFNDSFDYNFGSFAYQYENGFLNLGVLHNYEYLGTTYWGQIILDENYNTLKTLNQLSSKHPFSMVRTSDNKYIQASKTPELAEPYYSDILMFKLNENLEYDSVYTEVYEYDYECDHEIESGFIYFNDCQMIVGTEDIPNPQQYLEQKQKVNIIASPNPALEEIKLEFENTENHQQMTLRITSILGKQVYEQPLQKAQSEQIIMLKDWQEGLYLVQVIANGKVVGLGRFLKM